MKRKRWYSGYNSELVIIEYKEPINAERRHGNFEKSLLIKSRSDIHEWSQGRSGRTKSSRSATRKTSICTRRALWVQCKCAPAELLMNGIAESLHSGIRTFCTSFLSLARPALNRETVCIIHFFSGARELVLLKRDFALKLQHQEIGE